MPHPQGQTPSPTPDDTPTDPLAPIRDRILLHVKVTKHAPLNRVSTATSGVVFSGKRARSHLETFAKLHGDGCPTVLDPSAYEYYIATPEEPFSRKDPDLFSGDGLEDTLERLLESSASLVLAPTGFLRANAEGLRALQEAARRVDSLDTSRVVLALPLEAKWLAGDPEPLVKSLRQVRTPKALILGAEGNPVNSVDKAKALRRLVSQCPDTALLRTDLAGVDAMVHGASFASIGDTSSVRYTPLPWKDAWSNRPGDTSPHVLSPHLLDYFKGSRLAEYPGQELLRCSCAFCARWAAERHRHEPGRLLSDFHDRADTADAHAHNMAVWSGLWAYLARDGSLALARQRWERLCSDAVDSYEEFNEVIATRAKRFKRSSVLGYWAGRSR